MTLGRYGPLTLDQARKKAKTTLGKVLDGEDPLGNRRTSARGEIISDLCSHYIEHCAKPHKKSWRDDENRLRRM